MKFTFAVTLIFALGLSLGCTRSKSSAGRITLNFQSSVKSHNAAGTTNFPADHQVCYGVDVSGEGIAFQEPNACHPKRNLHVGFVSTNSADGSGEIALDVPVGDDRTVTVYAYLLPAGNTGSCPAWHGSVLDYSKVYKVGATDKVSIQPSGDNFVTVHVAYPGDENTVASTMNDYDSTSCSTTTNPPPGPTINLTVAPAYPVNGANWNDYVTYADESNGFLGQPDSACAVGSNGYFSCLNGGLHRVVEVPEITSCFGWSMYDALNVFKWNCDASSGHAKFYSEKFHDDKSLRDLVSGSGFLENSVTLSDGGANVYTSPASVWWGNNVSPLPDSSASMQTLSDAGTIFTFDANADTHGYVLAADRISIVGLNDARLDFTGGTNCDDTNTTFGAGPDRCLLMSANNHFHWIEGIYTNVAASGIITAYFNASHHNRFHNFASITSDTGLYLKAANSNLIRNSAVVGSVQNGLLLVGNANYNTVYLSRFTTNNTAIYVNNAHHNNFHSINSSNNSYYGLLIQSGSTNNVVSQSIIANNTYGPKLGSNRNTLSHLTVFGNLTAGATITGGQNTLNSIISTGQENASTTLGLSLTGGSASNNKIHNLVAPNNGISVRTAGGTDNNIFSGYLGVGNNNLMRCSRDGTSGTNSGFIDNTCTTSGANGSTTYSGHSSTAVLRDPLNLSGSFFWKVTADDSLNASDSNGQATFTSILDFVKFDSFYRFWGKDGTFINSGPCSGSDTCQIYDLSLLTSDTTVLNKSGDLTNNNQSFIANSICPAATHGNQTVTDSHVTPNTFLANAIEPVGDYRGDEDGLCESGEICLYAPNVGAYQGHSAGPLEVCNFQNGAVSNVLLLQLGANGI